MKNIFMLLLLSGVYTFSYSQTVVLKDRETNKPIELVSLASQTPRVSAITNAQGEVDISAFKDANEIDIRILGYKKVEKSYSDLASGSFEVFLEKSNFNLDMVVISATRWRQASSESPAKVLSISSQETKIQNPQTAADLLGISGKVYIQKSQQGGGSPMIRGFATNRLLYTIDGVRMNTAIFRGGNIQNVISLDPFAIENAEVLFGPGSVIYGSDAIGGVMSFQTLTPQLSRTDTSLITGKFIGRYSSANQEKTGHFDVNVGWKKWALTTSISSFDFDHLRQGSHGPEDYLKPFYVERIDSVDRVITQEDPLLQIPSAYSQMNLMQKIRFSPNEKWDFQYGFHYSETSPYGRYDRHIRLKNGVARYAEWYYGAQKWMMNNLSIEHAGGNLVYDQLNIRFAHQYFEESRIDRDIHKDERSKRIEKVNAYSANFDFTKSLGRKNTLSYGVEYILNDVLSTGINENIKTNASVTGPSRYPKSTWQSMGIYLNDQFKISDKVLLQGGVRYNQYILNADFDTTFYKFPFTTADLNKGAVTGSIGAVYRPAEDWVFNANLATAFRSPNVDDMGKVFDSEAGSVVIPNPDLEAEYAYNMDLGVTKVFGDFLKIEVSAYYTQLQNALVRRNFTLNGQDSMVYEGEMSRIQAMQNAATANVYGIQAGIEIKLPGGFGLSSDLNIQKGEEELDDLSKSASQHAPPLFGTTRLIYQANKLRLELYSNYQAKRSHEDLPIGEQEKPEIYAKDANGNPYAPSWYTLNLKAMYEFAHMLTLTAGIENITDQRYRPYASGISGAGRNFVFSLRKNF